MQSMLFLLAVLLTSPTTPQCISHELSHSMNSCSFSTDSTGSSCASQSSFVCRYRSGCSSTSLLNTCWHPGSILTSTDFSICNKACCDPSMQYGPVRPLDEEIYVKKCQSYLDRHFKISIFVMVGVGLGLVLVVALAMLSYKLFRQIKVDWDIRNRNNELIERKRNHSLKERPIQFQQLWVKVPQHPNPSQVIKFHSTEQALSPPQTAALLQRVARMKDRHAYLCAHDDLFLPLQSQMEHNDTERGLQPNMNPSSLDSFQDQPPLYFLTESCTICMEMSPNVKLECSHLFHLVCIREWMMRKKECGVCKHDLMEGSCRLYCRECFNEECQVPIKAVRVGVPEVKEYCADCSAWRASQ